jgi:predicted nucleic acid-binding protein
VARLILDSGAVFALAAGQPRARQVVERALRERTLLVIPAVVIAETTRGTARDARVNRVLSAVQDIAPVTESDCSPRRTSATQRSTR